MKRIGLAVSSVLLVVLTSAASLSAQQASFAGTVLNEVGEKPLANVEIVLEGKNISVRSDSAGNFTIPGLSAGSYTVLVRHLGFEPLRTQIQLKATDKMEADLLIKPAVTQLANVNVNANATSSPWAIKLVDFEERRKTGTGRYLTEDFFAAQDGKPLSSFLLSKVPGLKFVQNGGRKYMASTRNCGVNCPQIEQRLRSGMDQIPKACYLQVVVNGIVRYNGNTGQPMFDVDEINSKDIIGLEYYNTATTPLQYAGTAGTTGGCGTVIIWTKGG